MQAITSTRPKADGAAGDGTAAGPMSPSTLDWATMYTRRPAGTSTLFALEAMVAKRMELLAWIDQLSNSPAVKSFSAVLDAVGARLPMERRRFVSRHALTAPSAAAGGGDGVGAFVFDGDEDLLSHLLARFAFCMSEQWRKWFVRTEETLLRVRLRLQLAKCEADFLPALMRSNGLPCEPIPPAQREEPRLVEYMQYYCATMASQGKPLPQQQQQQQQQQVNRADEFFAVPIALATRLVKTRSVLCLRGSAILHREQAQEVFLTVFRAQLNRGLHEAYLSRMKLASHSDSAGDNGGDDERETVMSMLDAFLRHFVADPMSAMAEAESGSIGAADVHRLAQTHFPLCMRQTDEHVRREGHLKHTGRLTYGLFLKAIGLSLQDAMSLFSALMTQKGGGNGVEAFAKTSYGYNIRHNYGMEGKKTSYSSMSCATLMGLPPVVDRFDCHGCPFRYKDEGAFRSMLLKEQQNPLGKEFPPVRPTASDIEDIVQDCKGQHYTRACYKYFIATHPGARRDTLFRSPYEYYTVSRETSDEVQEQQRQHQGDASNTPSRGTDNFKRSMFTPTLKEDVIRQRTS